MNEAQATILIAEDAPDIRDILTRFLQRSGYRVIAANDGQAAVHLFEREQPDLVLLDLSMPILDGWQTLRAIRAFTRGSLPIVAVTAHAMPGDREAILEHGFDAYIAKPINFRALLELVQHYAKPKCAT